MTALVSVLMPVGRVDDYVSVAIDSVLVQHDIALELLIVGAPNATDSDNSLSVLLNRRYMNESRIRLLARDKPGIVSALNTGLRHASGDYIARMDADDIAEPDRLCTQWECAEAQPEHSLISACIEMHSDTNPIQAGNQRYQTWLNTLCTPADIRDACFIESPLPHPTWFAHRSIWDTVGLYADGDFPEDYDFVLRAWLAGVPMAKPARPLLRWREHPNRLTHTDSRYRREAFIERKATTLASPQANFYVDEGRPIWIIGTGRNARYWHDALVANNAVVAGFVDLDRAKAKPLKRGKPIIGYADLARVRNEPLILSVITDPTARSKLCDWFADQHLMIGKDVVLGG